MAHEVIDRRDAPRLLLEELELPYELNEMAFHPTDLKSDEHRARHPLGRIPVLDDGDIQIWESGAISV